VSHYLSSNLEAYNAYSLLNPDFSLEKIVMYVNLSLNDPFYTNTKEVQNPDDILVLCNKYNSLPSSYEPSDLVEVTNGNSAVSGLKINVTPMTSLSLTLCSIAHNVEDNEVMGFFYELSTSLIYSEGVIPVCFLNNLEKYFGLFAHPVFSATN